MKTTIFSTFRRYNANSKDKSVGDCVKRSLSFAYGVDYDEISRRLNRIKNDIGAYAFNSNSTWTKFLRDNGAQKITNDDNTNITEDEFCAKYPNGVYILLTGSEKKGYSTHMVCIINGDIVDSWNSSNYIVYDVWKIPNVSLKVEDIQWEDVEDPINEYIDKYLESVNKKYSDWFTCWREEGFKVNPLTYRMKFYVNTKDLPPESEFLKNRTYMKRIVVKLNPRMDVEKNIASVCPKLKQSVYNWLYQFEKDKRDCEAIKTIDNDNYRSSWDKKLLLKLPPWVRPYVTYFWVNETGKYSWGKYELRFNALPGDPHTEDRGDLISIETDSYRELKDILQAYKENYSREGYEY